ncbi:MAG TPA: FAD-linked oxidase C-terminal domain-containing protein [Bacteroidales bacterium]|nr:FAD-linked oxidase C-terminal domain-containing protein [Bacteroidales bacterium]
MKSPASKYPFDVLSAQLEGDVFYDETWRFLYATDASVYREIPAAVCLPKNPEDLKKVLSFCRQYKISIIPRTAGTSLAGQVVGQGLVVDFSRYMNRILELNTAEKWVRLEPGVILDELNLFLKPHGLFFGPETSTSNRCMIGGMVANNSCGANSLMYGSTRDHTLAIKALLADGSEVVFEATDNDAFRQKCLGSNLESRIYNQIFELLSNQENQQEIHDQYPDKRIKRRNTGYALDALLNSQAFGSSAEKFNFCKLLAGSEGTLALFTEITLNLVPLPPTEKGLLCIHLKTIEEALLANLVALEFKPAAVELIDKVVLDCSKENIEQSRNRFFVSGDPGAILVAEFAENSRNEILEKTEELKQTLLQQGLGYHFPLVFGNDMKRVWALRKAGLGVLSNVPGDAKPLTVIEDTALWVNDLPEFYKKHSEILKILDIASVYYAHIGSGELHMKPILNLKNPADTERFYEVAYQTALLVKQFRGSLSGEHGDGRLRGEFIPIMLGQKVYGMLQEVKKTWDPENLFNPGKILNTPSMKAHLRYLPGYAERKIKTFFDYSKTNGFLRAIENCNGSGDCRKPASMGGVMCPSYHAVPDEVNTTRGRANMLREIITHSSKKNPFDHPELLEVLEKCLQCKACKSECPSNIDMARFKSEVLQQFYLTNGTPVRVRLLGSINAFNRIGSFVPFLYNFLTKTPGVSHLLKKTMGFAQSRNLPQLQRYTLRQWAAKHLPALNAQADEKKKVALFCDEFTNYYDPETGIHAIKLLNRAGYRVVIPGNVESGRAAISKGLLKKASKIAAANLKMLHPLVQESIPLIGIEPSAILSFRDEYPDLCPEDLREAALSLAENSFTIEEFLYREVEAGRIDMKIFAGTGTGVYYHGHCHQKALLKIDYVFELLQMVPNLRVQRIECGCCGMAGSFGFEKKKYSLSMQIGEMNLFPAIRRGPPDAIICAAGISCRQQIFDGTGRKALHPVSVLFGSANLSGKPI